jgi:hypothetical protein
MLLEVPEEIYRPLLKTAEQSKQKPETLVIRWLASAVQRFNDDPLEKFIGAFKSDMPDWADQHDKYIGEALMQEMSNQKSQGD